MVAVLPEVNPVTNTTPNDGLGHVIGNTFWVSVWQASNQLPQVVTLPFVARALGPETLGLYAQMLAAGAYVLLFLDFGFNLTATRDVARSDTNLVRLRQLSSEVFTSKLLIAAPIAAFFVALLAILELPRATAWAFGAVFCGAALTSLTPSWLFLGLQRMKPLALANAVWKSIAAFLVIACARDADDLLFIAATNALAAAAVFLSSTWLIRNTCKHNSLSSVGAAWNRMRGSTSLFGANLAVNGYTYSVVLVVNLILGTTAAGIFSIADRVRQFAVGIFGPISQALYPSICRAVVHGETSDQSKARRLLFVAMLIVASLISIMLFAAADTIAYILGGPGFEHSAGIIRVMAFIPLIVTITGIMSTQTMLPNGLTREYLYVTIAGALTGIASVTMLTISAGVIGAGIGCLIAEIVVLGVSTAYVVRRGLIRELFPHTRTISRTDNAS